MWLFQNYLKNKKVDSLIDNLIVDSFVGDLTDIEKIEVKKDKEKGKRLVIIYKKKEDDRTDDPEPIVIELDYDNQIVGYTNKELQNVGDNFLSHNRALTELNLPQVQSIGGNFLCCNEILAKLSLPQVQSIEDGFLCNNKALTEVNLPQVQSVGRNFLYCNEALTEVSLPQVQSIEDNFLAENNVLAELNLPQVQSIGSGFLYKNKALAKLSMPQVLKIRNRFLENNAIFAEMFRRGGAEAIREYSARAKQENITPENALRCALSQGITTEQVNQANKIEQEQVKSKKQEYGKQQ